MTFPGIFPMTFFQTVSAAVASGIIVSIQPFEIVMVSGVATNTATIAAVDGTRTVIFPAGLTQTNSVTAGQNSRARSELTDPTTISVFRTGTVGDVTVRGAAVEFNSTGVESVEYGLTTFASANLTATTTVTSANMARTAIFNLGFDATNGSTATIANFTPTIELTDPTTVTLRRDLAGATTFFGTGGWVLCRFVSGVATVQHQMFTSTSAGLSEQHAIPTPVNPARSFIAWGGVRGASTTEQDFLQKVQLSSSAATTITRNEGSTDTHGLHYNVVEVNQAYINTIQRGTTTIISSALSGTATITSANTSKTAIAWGGFSTGGDQPNEQESTAKITNATTITSEKGAVSSTGSDNAITAWEAVSFV